MGYRKVPIIYTLTFEGTEWEGLIVRLKSLKIGLLRQMMDVMEDDDVKTTVMVGKVIEIIAGNIVSWNLEGEEGPLEPTLAELEDLEFPMVFEIANRWLEKITGPGAELGKASPSGEQFPGAPVKMEAL